MPLEKKVMVAVDAKALRNLYWAIQRLCADSAVEHGGEPSEALAALADRAEEMFAAVKGRYPDPEPWRRVPELDYVATADDDLDYPAPRSKYHYD